MPVTQVSSRQFNQDVSRVKRAARKGPVIITDRGRPAHVLLTIEEYRRLRGDRKTVAELFGDEAAAAIEFDPPRMGDDWLRPADLS